MMIMNMTKKVSVVPSKIAKTSFKDHNKTRAHQGCQDERVNQAQRKNKLSGPKLDIAAKST